MCFLALKLIDFHLEKKDVCGYAYNMRLCPGRTKSIRGFTLIELMIAVSVVGVLASIVLPKLADAVTRAKESSVKGQLGSLRSAVNLYYCDNEGIFPVELSQGLTMNAR